MRLLSITYCKYVQQKVVLCQRKKVEIIPLGIEYW